MALYFQPSIRSPSPSRIASTAQSSRPAEVRTHLLLVGADCESSSDDPMRTAKCATADRLREQIDSGLLDWRLNDLRERTIALLRAEHEHHQYVYAARRAQEAQSRTPPACAMRSLWLAELVAELGLDATRRALTGYVSASITRRFGARIVHGRRGRLAHGRTLYRRRSTGDCTGALDMLAAGL